MALEKWVRVNRHNRCPICKKPDWCLVAVDGQAALCQRVESKHRVAEAGWLHRLSDPAPAPRPAHRQADAPHETPDVAGMLRQWEQDTDRGRLIRHAADLGVTPTSLRRLGCCWAANKAAWAFPMRNAEYEVVGVRLRAENARKWAVTGSREGLFIPDQRVGELCERIIVCEGPTDTAAILDCGHYAIGRPSCTGAVRDSLEILAGRNVVIMADRDRPKQRPDGTTWYPGVEGAQRLAKALAGHVCTLKMIRPVVGKDAREWLARGLTGDVLDAVIRNAKHWRPQNGR